MRRPDISVYDYRRSSFRDSGIFLFGQLPDVQLDGIRGDSRHGGVDVLYGAERRAKARA